MFLSYYCYILFIPMLMITNFMMINSTSWFSMWMVMEINMISFISLIIFDKNLINEVLLKYFLVQATNSYLFLMSMIMLNYLNYKDVILLIMNLSMLTKLGMPPFYMWYLNISNNLNWMNIFILMTLQKIIPLIILSNIFIYKFSMHLNLMIMLLMGIYSSMKGLIQVKLKLLFCYSSIIQMSWVIILLIFNEMMGFLYFLIYSMINLNLMMLMYKFNIINLNMFSMIKHNSKINFYMMNLSIFSLASIPPFMGFMMKLISIQFLFNQISLIMLILLIMNSLISVFFYLRMIFSNLLINSYSFKQNYKYINFSYINNYKLLMLTWLSMTMLLIYEMF